MRRAVLLGCLLFAGCEDTRHEMEQAFKTEFQKQFAASCTEGAVAKGAPRDKVEPLCGCTARELVARHDSVTLTKMSAALQAGQEAPELVAAIQTCRGVPAGQ